MLTQYRNALLAAGKSRGTVEQRLAHIYRLGDHYPHLLGVTAHDLEEYLAERRFTHAAETRKSMRSSFRSFYSWAVRAGYLDENPAAELAPVPIPRTLPRVAPDIDLQVALVRATDHERAMIMLARYGCLRLSELTSLHTSQREGDVLRIVGKGEKERLVPANDELLHALVTLERQQGHGYYFPGKTGPHMHSASVGKIITRVTGWNPHSLRHAGATAAYRATGDIRAVQEFLGHASMATTQRYLHPEMNDIRRVAAATSMRTYPQQRVAA